MFDHNTIYWISHTICSAVRKSNMNVYVYGHYQTLPYALAPGYGEACLKLRTAFTPFPVNYAG